MARRQGALAPVSKKTIDPNAARLAIAKHLTHLTSMHDVNMAQFRAQVSEVEAVETLVGFMRDAELPPALRRQCAIDIVTFARGGIKVWAHSSQTINRDEPGEIEGATVGDELTAAKNTTELYQKFDRLVSQGIHPDDWPEDVKSIAGDLIEHYSKVGTIIEG